MTNFIFFTHFRIIIIHNRKKIKEKVGQKRWDRKSEKANHDCRNVSYDTCDRNDSVHKSRQYNKNRENLRIRWEKRTEKIG